MTPPASSDDWAVWYGGQRQCTGRRTLTFSPFLHIPCAELAFGLVLVFLNVFVSGLILLICSIFIWVKVHYMFFDTDFGYLVFINSYFGFEV